MDAQTSSDVTREEIRELIGELRALERRVGVVERALERTVPAASAPASSEPLPDLQVSSDLVPTIGRALLAIAGAYLLRALTELHVLSPRAGVVFGIFYAGFWLWRAVRAASRMDAVVNAITSVAILIPLLWEAMMRLHVIPAAACAAILVSFAIASIRRRDAAAIACAGAAAIAGALFVGTHDLLPFTLALLLIAAAADWTDLAGRWFPALCADIAVALLTFVVARGVPESYAPISVREAVAIEGLLALLFGAGVVARTAISGATFTVYRIAQTAIAVGVSLAGALYLTGQTVMIGWLAAAAGAACYGIAFGIRLSNRSTQTYAAFGTLLAICGVYLLMPAQWAVAALSLAAVALCWTPAGTFQAPIVLWIVIVISGAGEQSAAELFFSPAVFPRAASAVLCAAGLLCYGRLRHPAAGAVALAGSLWCAAGLASSLGVGSIALVVFAVSLAWCGARFKRKEPIWLMYGSMGLAGVRILVHDFSRESTQMLVLALLVYGASLIALPRILQRRVSR